MAQRILLFDMIDQVTMGLQLMMWRIIKHPHGHPLKKQKILLPNEYPCAAYSQVRMKILVLTDISVLEFYGYIGG